LRLPRERRLPLDHALNREQAVHRVVERSATRDTEGAAAFNSSRRFAVTPGGSSSIPVALQDRAAARERHAVDQQLKNQTPRSGAERNPQRHFLLSC
jgi:hypothetical protein